MKFLFVLCLGFLCSVHGAVELSYHSVKLADLDFEAEDKLVESALKKAPLNQFGKARLTIRCAEICYAGIGGVDNEKNDPVTQGGLEVVFALKNDGPVKGFADLKTDDRFRGGTLEGFEFTFTPTEETKTTKKRFEEIRSEYVQRLAVDHLPGTAWFRYLSVENVSERDRQNWQRRRDAELNNSFEFFSGGRAVSENLALNRDLILAVDKDGAPVPLADIQGVTVDAIDWSDRLPEGEIKVDLLSLSIPENQHAVFLRSLPELLSLIDRFDSELTPVAQTYSVRNPFRKIAERYQKQMGMDVAPVAARLMPVKGVAVTGGDPFFPMGTDMAIVMDTDAPELLFRAILKVVESKAKDADAGEMKFEKMDGNYRGFQREDRSFSSHICQIGKTVVVSNSIVQIERLLAVANKKETALGSTDEYRFFRHRYPIDAEESAFIFMSDAAIRRWAGPKLRIAASRRTRALAAMGEMTSQALAGEEITDDYRELLGESVWADGRIISANYGTMDFMKPASELDFETVSKPEKEAYERWRRGYERGWSQVFDPIAIRLVSKKDELGVDLSVIPLTIGSDFQEFVELCGKAELSEKARWVPEEALLHAAVAIDTEGQRFRRYNDLAVEFLPGIEVNPLSWMSGSVSLDMEKSLFWEARSENDFDRILKAPLLLRIGSKSQLKLALFMTAVKGTIQTSAPGSITWQIRQSDVGSYVAILPKEDEIGTDMQLYYATVSKALLISLREDVLIRAIRREKHKLKATEVEKLAGPTQLMLQTSPRFFAGLESMIDATDPMDRIREESWKALPILNEWQRRFPDQNPVTLQARHYGENIYCPGGKGYRWNAEALTMESIAFGHPSDLKSDPVENRGIMDFEELSSSLQFEDDGLRARLFLGKFSERVPTPMRENVDPKLLAKAKDLLPEKSGTVLSYKGHSYGMKVNMQTEYANFTDDNGVFQFQTKTKWTVGDEEDQRSEESFVLKDGLFLKSISYDETSSQYEKPILELPAELVVGAVTRGVASGIEEWKDEDGALLKELFKSEFLIRVLGKEDIEVPAGKFEGCIKVEVFSEAITGGVFNHNKYLRWYHLGTGMVKTEMLEGGQEVIELEKISVPDEAD
ncbi:MAG: hypothetical protein AB8D78_01355 [Akkermansiaceae bacterium]